MEYNTGDVGGVMADMWVFGRFWVGVAISAIVVVYFAVARRSDNAPIDTALNALRERYARGEIDDAEYQVGSFVPLDTLRRASGQRQ